MENALSAQNHALSAQNHALYAQNQILQQYQQTMQHSFGIYQAPQYYISPFTYQPVPPVPNLFNPVPGHWQGPTAQYNQTLAPQSNTPQYPIPNLFIPVPVHWHVPTAQFNETMAPQANMPQQPAPHASDCALVHWHRSTAHTDEAMAPQANTLQQPTAMPKTRNPPTNARRLFNNQRDQSSILSFKPTVQREVSPRISAGVNSDIVASPPPETPKVRPPIY